MQIIIIIIVIIAIVAIIREIFEWLADHIIGVLITLGIIVAICVLVYLIINDPGILYYIGIGLVIIAGIIFFIILVRAIVNRIKYVRKTCKKRKADSLYIKLYNYINNIYMEEKKSGQLMLDSIICACNNNSSLRKCFDILIGDSKVNGCVRKRDIIIFLVSTIEKNNIRSFLKNKIQEVGAYTCSEAVNYCLNEMKLVAITSGLSNAVQGEINHLVSDKVLSRNPMGTDDVLYSNNTNSGAKLVTRTIEM